jgi:DNA polymerase I-like protein with 3'-5' exonuclease and polymerase domains
MLELWPLCKEFGAKYLLSVHDEHDTSAPKKEAEEFKSRKKAILECFDGESCPIHCRVPILSSVASGPNWWEACK